MSIFKVHSVSIKKYTHKEFPGMLFKTFIRLFDWRASFIALDDTCYVYRRQRKEEDLAVYVGAANAYRARTFGKTSTFFPLGKEKISK